MKSFLPKAGAVFVSVLFLFNSACLDRVYAQQQKSSSVDNGSPDIQKIIRAFTAKETEFRKALSEYAFKRDATIKRSAPQAKLPVNTIEFPSLFSLQTIGAAGEVTGEYHRVSQFVFTDQNERFEKITYFPPPTLTELIFTQEDLEDLGGVQPFALEASKIDQYDFKYVGREQVDELHTYVFDVAPKVLPKKVSDRRFEGRIWVDEDDLQIVKVRGKAVPQGNQRFPLFRDLSTANRRALLVPYVYLRRR